ncbi:hypothetical protein ACPTIQ_30960, partial [Pseudomonas aeruginosa]
MTYRIWAGYAKTKTGRCACGGLPAAWAGRLAQDSVSRLAEDVGGLFRLWSFELVAFVGEYACGVGD